MLHFNNKNTIHKFEKNLIYFCMSILTFFLFYLSNFTFKKLIDFSSEYYAMNIFSILLMLALTLFPYITLLLMNRRFHKRVSLITSYTSSLIVSIFIITISLFLYYQSWASVDMSASSTASLIYAVLPFYILIGIIIIYGGFMLSTKEKD